VTATIRSSGIGLPRGAASNGQQWPAMDGAGSEGGLEIFDKAAGGTRGHWQTVGAVALSDEPSQHQDHGDHAGAAGAVLHWAVFH
jgi:hypothetical protein